MIRFFVLVLILCSSIQVTMFANSIQKFKPKVIIGFEGDEFFPGFISDAEVYSPKSVQFNPNGDSFYVQALEGGKTLCYSVQNLKKTCSIKHDFSSKEDLVHRDMDISGIFKQPNEQKAWSGKPVEAVIDQNGKYLYVTSYRKSFDQQGVYASSLSVIDTNSSQIVTSLPTDSIPKMVAISNNQNLLAVTNWGNNSITFWKISDEPKKLTLLNHFYLGAKQNIKDITANRDKECGLCLRGTVFTLDDSYALVSGMHAGNTVYLVSPYKGLVKKLSVPFSAVRHLVSSKKLGRYYFSTLGEGSVCSISHSDIISAAPGSKLPAKMFKCAKINSPVKTIDVNDKTNLGVAALSSGCAIVTFNPDTMNIAQTLPAPCYPAGVAISPNGSKIIVTAQGKEGVGGHKVGVYENFDTNMSSR